MFRYIFFILIRRKWFFFALAVMFLIAYSTPPSGLDFKGMAVLGITAMAIILFVSSAIPLPATAILIAFFQVALGVGRPNQIARSFTGDSMLFIMGILLISNILIYQKIDKRLARLLVKFTGLNISRLAFGIMVLCALLAAFIGEHTASAILFPVVLSFIAGIKPEHKSKGNAAKLLLFCLAYSSMIGGLATPSGGARNPLMIEYLWRIAGIKVNYLQWTVFALPITIFLIPVIYFILKITFRIKKDATEIINEENLKINASTRHGFSGTERLTILIFLIILTLWIFFSDQLGMGIIALIGVFLYLITGVADWREISKKTNWGIILIYASALSLGLAMKQTGVTVWFAEGITDLLFTLNINNKMILIGFIGATSSLLSDILSHGPSVAVSAPIFLRLADVTHINVLSVGLINAITSSFGFLTIIAAPTNSLIYTSGYIKTIDYIKAGWLCTIMAVAVTILFSIFYWNLLGYSL